MTSLRVHQPSVKPPRPVRPLPSYVAASCCDVIDTGNRLEAFLKQLCRDWGELVSEDLAVWEEATGEDHGPRLVAVIRPGDRGQPTVLYL